MSTGYDFDANLHELQELLDAGQGFNARAQEAAERAVYDGTLRVVLPITRALRDGPQSLGPDQYRAAMVHMLTATASWLESTATRLRREAVEHQARAS